MKVGGTFVSQYFTRTRMSYRNWAVGGGERIEEEEPVRGKRG